MADDAAEAQPGIHVGQAEGRVQPNRRVQQRDGVRNHKEARGDGPNRSENDNLGFCHGRHRHMRVWPEAGRHQERQFGLPPVLENDFRELRETDNRPGDVDDLALGDPGVKGANVFGRGHQLFL